MAVTIPLHTQVAEAIEVQVRERLGADTPVDPVAWGDAARVAMRIMDAAHAVMESPEVEVARQLRIANMIAVVQADDSWLNRAREQAKNVYRSNRPSRIVDPVAEREFVREYTPLGWDQTVAEGEERLLRISQKVREEMDL